MFKPKKMKRTLIVGSKLHLETTIETLHELNIVHIVDYIPTDEYFRIGAPLPKGTDISKKLIKVRSITDTLQLRELEKREKFGKIGKTEILKNLDEKIATLELNVTAVSDTKSKVENAINDLNQKIEHLRHFAKLSIPLEFYRGYENIRVFVGYVKSDIDLSKITDEFEIVKHIDKEGILITIFVSQKFANDVKQTLTDVGFTELKIPEGSGMPTELILDYERDKAKLESRLETTLRELEVLRRKHANYILALEEYLSIESEKADAPTRFATTANSFMVDCWIPEKELSKVKSQLDTRTNGSLYITTLDEHSGEETPVALENPKPSRSFEYIVQMYSTPRYKEVDPTLIIFVTFPLFFGLMIGDLGYGILFVLLGLFLRKHKLVGIGGPAVGNILILCGIYSCVIGVFVFGEAFGIHFVCTPHHPPEGLSWAKILFGYENAHYFYTIFGTHFPLSKLLADDIRRILLLTLIIAFAHICAGLIIGFINEREHFKKAFLDKFGWLFAFTAGFLIILFLLSSALHLNISIIALYVGFGFLVASAIMLLLGKGGIEVAEIPKIFSNTLSYTRLSAIGLSKAGMALAFNMMGFEMIIYKDIHTLTLNSPIYIVCGILVLIMGHLIVLLSGLIAGGLHSLRLQYVEFFTKFYEGGGVPYKPFGYTRKYTVG
jgi:V/A-type H+-transporting ATPase subunit I